MTNAEMEDAFEAAKASYSAPADRPGWDESSWEYNARLDFAERDAKLDKNGVSTNLYGWTEMHEMPGGRLVPDTRVYAETFRYSNGRAMCCKAAMVFLFQMTLSHERLHVTTRHDPDGPDGPEPSVETKGLPGGDDPSHKVQSLRDIVALCEGFNPPPPSPPGSPPSYDPPEPEEPFPASDPPDPLADGDEACITAAAHEAMRGMLGGMNLIKPDLDIDGDEETDKRTGDVVKEWLDDHPDDPLGQKITSCNINADAPAYMDIAPLWIHCFECKGEEMGGENCPCPSGD